MTVTNEELKELLQKIARTHGVKEQSLIPRTPTLKQSMVGGVKTGTIAFILFKVFGPIIHLINYTVIWTLGLIVMTVANFVKFIQERYIKGNQDFKFSYNWGVKQLENNPASLPMTVDNMFKTVINKWADAGQPLPPAGKQLELKEAIATRMNRNV